MVSRTALGTVILALTCIAVNADAETLVTITCEKPNGFRMEYGTSAEAATGSEPEKATLSGPTKDAYRGKPTFIVDPTRKNMIVIWNQSPEDAAWKKQAKDLFNLNSLSPVPAADAVIVAFSDEQISAVKVDAGSVMTYSLFPKSGTMFINQQYVQPGLKKTVQISAFASCEFSWAAH
jgi:hypothetical protein